MNQKGISLLTEFSQFPIDFLPQAKRAEGWSVARRSYFMSGPENWMLRHVLGQLLADPLSVCSPLTIWGPSGTGKTTALAGLCEGLAVSAPHHTVQMIDAGLWMRQEAIAENSPDWDLLLLDDLHQLIGRDAAQESLVLAIDSADDRDRCLIVSSQFHPASIHGLLPKLVSRLLGGTTVKVEEPSRHYRAKIAQKFAFEFGWRLSDEAAQFTSQTFPTGSIRHLKHAITQCLPVRPANDETVNLDTMRQLLTQKNRTQVTPLSVQKMVAAKYDISVRELTSASRRRNVVEARSVAIYVLRKLTNLPFKKIGSFFGKRDHTTVIHAYRKIDNQIRLDTRLDQWVTELTVNIRGASSL